MSAQVPRRRWPLRAHPLAWLELDLQAREERLRLQTGLGEDTSGKKVWRSEKLGFVEWEAGDNGWNKGTVGACVQGATSRPHLEGRGGHRRGPIERPQVPSQ